MTLVNAPFVHSCCEHQFVAGLQSNEQKLLFAIATFWKAQAPGGILTAPLAEAAEKLIAVSAPANKAIFATDIARILRPLSQKMSPPALTGNILHYNPGDASRFASQWVVMGSAERSQRS